MRTNIQIILCTLWESIRFSFSIVGFSFTIIEMLKTLSVFTVTPAFVNFQTVLITFSLFSLLFFLRRILKLSFQTHSISETSMTVASKAANVLKQRNGSILIGINDELEYELEKVGKNSLQGQLIKKYGQDWMQQVMETYKSQHPLPAGQTVYPIGTAFSVDDPKDKHHFIFLVISHLQSSGVPFSSPEKLKEALNVLFEPNSTFRCHKNRLYAPLIGSGLTGLTISRQELARMIAFRFIHRKNDCMAVHHLVITYRYHTISAIRPLELSAELAHMSKHCRNCLEL